MLIIIYGFGSFFEVVLIYPELMNISARDRSHGMLIQGQVHVERPATDLLLFFEHGPCQRKKHQDDFAISLEYTRIYQNYSQILLCSTIPYYLFLVS